MVFFQVALLAGYLYAHLLTTRMRFPWSAGLHLTLLAFAAATVSLRLPADVQPPSSTSGAAEMRWLFTFLVTALGVPTLLLASHAPLLQHWFSRSRHADAHDPYFLYGASNVGSLLALPIGLSIYCSAVAFQYAYPGGGRQYVRTCSSTPSSHAYSLGRRIVTPLRCSNAGSTSSTSLRSRRRITTSFGLSTVSQCRGPRNSDTGARNTRPIFAPTVPATCGFFDE